MMRDFVRIFVVVFGLLCICCLAIAEDSDELRIPALEIVPDGIRLGIGYAHDFSNAVEVFACTDLLERAWQLVATNLENSMNIAGHRTLEDALGTAFSVRWIRLGVPSLSLFS